MLARTFTRLPPKTDSSGILEADVFPGRPHDYIARGLNGEPVCLFTSTKLTYRPSIRLRHLSVDFGVKCRIRSEERGGLEKEFLVVACSADDRELYDFFLHSIEAICADLPSPAPTLEIQKRVESLIELFRKLEEPNTRTLKGLWAELFLISASRNVESWVEAWHSTSTDKFDFAWPDRKIEVKAAESSRRVHEFSLGQLQGPAIAVASLLLRRNASGLGVLELANDISSKCSERPDLLRKLWSNCSEALGADFAANLDIRFDPVFATRNMRALMAENIPRPEVTSTQVFDVRFKVDISEQEELSEHLMADLLS